MPPAPAARRSCHFLSACLIFLVAPGIRAQASSPGELRLRTLPLRDNTTRIVLTRSATADGPFVPLDTLTITQHVRGRGDSAVVERISTYGPPIASVETTTTHIRGLVPISARAHSAAQTFEFLFGDRRLTGHIAKRDSAPQSIDVRFREPIYDFDDHDLVAAALPFAIGFQVVLPFSTTGNDERVEYDTLRVVDRGMRSTTRGDRSVWIVRFADPAIVEELWIDATTAEIRRREITSRRSSAKFRLEPLPDPEPR